jgi:hypothetical protein
MKCAMGAVTFAERFPATKETANYQPVFQLWQRLPGAAFERRSFAKEQN